MHEIVSLTNHERTIHDPGHSNALQNRMVGDCPYSGTDKAFRHLGSCFQNRSSGYAVRFVPLSGVLLLLRDWRCCRHKHLKHIESHSMGFAPFTLNEKLFLWVNGNTMLPLSPERLCCIPWNKCPERTNNCLRRRHRHCRP